MLKMQFLSEANIQVPKIQKNEELQLKIEDDQLILNENCNTILHAVCFFHM